VAVDLDASRCELAMSAAAIAAGTPKDFGWRNALSRLSGGHGADVVLICAGSSDNSVLELAASAVRERGRIVVIGKSKLDLDYNTFFRKEIEVSFSRSYGPGRYDTAYENEGRDYPYAYVRWTERRNIKSFIDLLATRRLDLTPIIGAVRFFSGAATVYDEIHDGKEKAIGVLLDYGVRDANVEQPSRVVRRESTTTARPVVVGIIGAGNYASSMLIPPLKADSRVELGSLITSTGLSAASAARRFDIQQHGTDRSAVLNDPRTNGVLIATRHASHAGLAAEALRAGKAVFVEKPLAINEDGLALVDAAIADRENAQLMVGFNRRFSPIIRDNAAAFAGKGPLMMLYRVQAGTLPPDAWQNSMTEGGRFIGEAGHFFDVFQYLTGSRAVSVSATRIAVSRAQPDDHDNISAVVSYADGSVGTLIYSTQGNSLLDKEYLEVHASGQSTVMRNFRSLETYAASGRVERKKYSGEKGQKEQMRLFADMIASGDPAPTPYTSLAETTRLTWKAYESARDVQPYTLE
jgi:predicted dehydrogenase